MEVRLNLGYEQILQLVRQLPSFEKQRLTRELERELAEEPVQTADNDELNEFQKLLLNGPVMSDKQFEQFQKVRSNYLARSASSIVGKKVSLTSPLFYRVAVVDRLRRRRERRGLLLLLQYYIAYGEKSSSIGTLRKELSVYNWQP